MSSQGPAKRRLTQATDKPVKRTRVSRACDQCRLAREKCNGAQPTCSTCSVSRRACTYTANVKKRGIQPGYIRALELALAYLFQHDSENENLVNEKLAQGRPSSLLLSRGSKESNKLHKRWRKTRFYTDVDKLLSGGEPSRHDQSEPLSPDTNEENSGTEEPSSTAVLINRNERQAHDQRMLSMPTNQLLSQQSGSLNACISMPLESWKLLEGYFTYTHCWFPICEKHDILKLSYSYPAQGLTLSPALLDSGLHAELWSVLAVASAQEALNPDRCSQDDISTPTSAQLYATAKSLIPDEVGRFDLGHVKALLNLAICNISESLIGAAWLLVAYASRILDLMDQSMLVTNPRHKHVLHGCFILDGLLAIHLDRCPYLRKDEVRRLGRIDEEGLDEWQPWTGGSHKSLTQKPRTPILALSTFNAILDIVALLVKDEESAQNTIQRLKIWESSLPPKLAFICGSNVSGPLNPPAVLIQSTYYCASLALTSSPSWLSRLLDLLEMAQDQIGWSCLPPVLQCLLDFVNRLGSGMSLSSEVKHRLKRLQNATSIAWSNRMARTQGQVSNSPTRHSITGVQMSTPLSIMQPLQKPAIGDTMNIALSPPDSTPPGPLSMAVPSPHVNVLQAASIPNQLDPRYPEIPTDLESFFDELASLDTANNMDNQPQFMQNLGFAPDASMADLFSEYTPLQSTTFMSQDNSVAVNLDHYGFYDGS